MNIQDDVRFNQFFELSGIAETTKYNYTRYMEMFCECVGKTPTELIEESIKETKQGLLVSERKTMIYLTQYKKCLKDLAPKTQNLALSVVKSFYNAFDIQLPSSMSKQKKATPLEINMNFINKDDVKTLIVNTHNLRDRAIILMMATSGTARQEIINLRFSNIEYDTNGIGILRIRRQKSQTDYVTFISPEATIALKNYLDERNRNEDTKIKDNKNGLVFVTYGAGGKGGEIGTKISERAFNKIFKDLGDGLGYDNGDGYVKTRSHSLRKFFASTMENAGVPKNKVDFMLGHTVNGVDLAYFKNDISKLKEMYLKYLPYITFEKTIEVRSLDTKDAERLETLEKENAQLKQEHDSENKQLQKKMKEQQEQIDLLMNMVKAGWKPPE